MRTMLMLLALLACSLPVAAGAAPGAAAVPAGAVDILCPESYWRWFLVLRKPIIPAAALRATGQEAAGPKLLTGQQVHPPYAQVDHLESPPPPAGWEQPAFADAGWPRSRLSWLGPAAYRRFSSAALCLRGRFLVTDPADVQGLYLTVKYYGGVRVTLNGREIARRDLPEGPLAPDTPATAYLQDVYVDARGEVLPGDYGNPLAKLARQERQEIESRIARRTRTLGPIALPAAALHKGENLLAIELRRTEYPAVAPQWFKPPLGGTSPQWVPLHIFDLRLQGAGQGVVPNVARPQGVQVWTENVNDRICTLDYGDCGTTTHPVVIAGARNGSFCGQLVIGSDQPLRSAKVTVSDLKTAKGGGIIPASRVAVYYALPNVSYYGMPTWFDALQREPPAEVAVAPRGGGALLPVLLRVAVPRDAATGNYRGEVTVTVAGAEPVKVPIQLSVADWAVPDPRDYRTYVGVYQSPTSLALKYQVKEWSEEHWRLMDRSYALLGRAGNKLVNVTVVDQTQFGNDDGMIYWVRQPNGSYRYDFTVFDRLVALALKHFGKPDYVALHVWHSGGWETRAADQRNTVTVIDARTGRREHLQVPKFGTEASKKFWKPLLDAVRARLARQGLESTMCLGILSDGTAPPEVFKALNEITPGGARWMRGCHSGTFSEAPDPLRGGGRTVLHEFCYGLMLPDPAKSLPPFWKQRGWPGTAYDRISAHEAVVPLSWYRDTALCSLLLRTRGVGRVCLDFWDVLGNRGQQDVYNRWPYSSCAQREPSLKTMAWPGPDGPETTLRYEAFCEGIQYAEALMVVSEALDRKAAQLGQERAEVLRQVLVDLVRQQHKYRGPYVPLRPNHEGWQPLARRLLEAAALACKEY